MRSSPLLAAAVLLSLAGAARAATTIDKVEIRGLDEGNEVEALMIENIHVALSLSDAVGKRQGESRLEYLMTEAQAETREALEPFGYYSPQITVDAVRPGGEDEHITVVVDVAKGEPVRVRNSELTITGEGGEDRYLKEDLAAFRPQVGDIFDHTTYETSKTQIVRRLADRGYFDADFIHRRVEVTRAARAADIDLEWVSGIRYDMGPTTFHQDKFKPGLLDKLVYWEEGSYFHQGKLDRLRESLVGMDYFNNIDIQASPDKAVDGRVPIDVNLTLAKRDIYTTGLSYGTESGAGVRFGLERRYVNSRGHKLSTQLDYAQKRKNFVTQYRIPAFKWLDGWYTATLQAYDEQTDYIDTRLLKLSGSRSGQINDYLTATASINTLRERWAYTTADDLDPETVAPLVYRYATFTYPEVSAEYVDVDSRTFPRAGTAASMTLRGGVEGAGSDANFVQLHLQARWFKGIGASDRFILRGELGHTFTGALDSLPPSLRFYAGGDRSIRGYQYREVGPQVITEKGKFSVGAKNVVTASAEYEHYFNGSWGAAAFVDSGSAFDGKDADWRTGVGVGVRWKSPVGAVRIDIGHGLDDPDSQFTIGLGIGAEF